MQFDLTDLRLFVRTAEEGALTRAAARQHLSLAAASARIKALEEQSGLPLLYREARGVRLTPAGDAFLHHARGLLHQTERLRAELQEYGGGLRGPPAHVRQHHGGDGFPARVAARLSGRAPAHQHRPAGKAQCRHRARRARRPR